MLGWLTWMSVDRLVDRALSTRAAQEASFLKSVQELHLKNVEDQGKLIDRVERAFDEKLRIQLGNVQDLLKSHRELAYEFKAVQQRVSDVLVQLAEFKMIGVAQTAQQAEIQRLREAMAANAEKIQKNSTRHDVLESQLQGLGVLKAPRPPAQ